MVKVIKKVFSSLISIKLHPEVCVPQFRVVGVFQNQEGDYRVNIQLINKNAVYCIKPEEILADDRMVNKFSPCDVRMLTYLGYLDINSPGYKILAQTLSEKQDHLVFSVKKKGVNQVVKKTASEIFSESEIVNGLNRSDGHAVSFALGYESVCNENAVISKLMKSMMVP